MNVGSEKETVFWIIVVFAAIWLDVSRFQEIADVATGDEAPILVPLAQCLAELRLAAAIVNLAFDHVPVVALLRTV